MEELKRLKELKFVYPLDLCRRMHILSIEAGMYAPIDEQVIDFYHALFERVFSEPFRPRINDRLKRNAVIRQVEESADAASQSLTRFFRNERLTAQHVADVLEGFAMLSELLKISDIANPNVTPVSVIIGAPGSGKST